mgnify:CR=1 FL=1
MTAPSVTPAVSIDTLEGLSPGVKLTESDSFPRMAPIELRALAIIGSDFCLKTD